MNVKKDVMLKIEGLLQQELSKVQYQIARNKDEFRRLEREQAILKRERAKLSNMIRGLKNE